MTTLLDGLRVLEFAGQYTGVGGRLLAELGGDVVVVEPPTGASTRHRPPFVDDTRDPDRSLRWWAENVGKRSVTVDPDDPAEIERLRALIRTVDVVIADDISVADGRIRHHEVAQDNPGVIWVAVTPFGRDSARASDPTTDLTMMAGAGPVWNCGYDDHSIPPIHGGGDQATNIAGHYCAIGALAALAHRDRTGRGQLVDVNVTAACNVTSEQTTYNWLVAGETCVRQTGRHAYFLPSSPVQVRCADGAYATTGILPRRPTEFADMLAWLRDLDLEEEFPEAVFLEMAAGREAPLDIAKIGVDDETTAILSAAREAMGLIASRLPAHEFFTSGQRRGFPVGAVLTVDEAFEDEHVVARGFPLPVDHPELDRTVRYPGRPYHLHTADTPVPARPPLVGEHDRLLYDPATSKVASRESVSATTDQ
ncbi:CoA transferase [uncultured Williamsia sp.]|uniref:CoA transferase n=1 Tax=uncultured Williamsia sp. TaxID=259311 RepID=UPI00262967E0|nr:CoA transferase [uncultured Williamsia sp.]